MSLTTTNVGGKRTSSPPSPRKRKIVLPHLHCKRASKAVGDKPSAKSPRWTHRLGLIFMPRSANTVADEHPATARPPPPGSENSVELMDLTPGRSAEVAETVGPVLSEPEPGHELPEPLVTEPLLPMAGDGWNMADNSDTSSLPPPMAIPRVRWRTNGDAQNVDCGGHGFRQQDPSSGRGHESAPVTSVQRFPPQVGNVTPGSGDRSLTRRNSHTMATPAYAHLSPAEIEDIIEPQGQAEDTVSKVIDALTVPKPSMSVAGEHIAVSEGPTQVEEVVNEDEVRPVIKSRELSVIPEDVDGSIQAPTYCHSLPGRWISESDDE